MTSESTYDVLVTGGGPAGVGAAIGAGQLGAKVAVVERHPFLGGMGTAALVNNFCPAHHDGKRDIIGGVFGTLRQRLIERRSLYTAAWIECYDPDVFIEELTAMAKSAGAALFLGYKIRSSTFEKSGEVLCTLEDGSILRAKTIVDATGDGLISNAAGVEFTFGRRNDRAVMPLTYCYKMGPIDLPTAKRETPRFIRHDKILDEEFYFLSGNYPEVDEKIALARERGELSIPRDHISGIFSMPGQPQNATVNFGRVTIEDPTDAEELAAAETTGKRQVEEGIAFFRKHLPGFEQVELLQLARQIGVRESRHLVAEHILTGREVLEGCQFEDVIAQCCYPVDIHEPGSDRTAITEIGGPGHFDIPLRSLIPRKGPDNLIVAGRSIGATHEAASSFRVSPSVMAIGEAAGVAAGLAARNQKPVRDVSAREVQEQLLATGGILA